MIDGEGCRVKSLCNFKSRIFKTVGAHLLYSISIPITKHGEPGLTEGLLTHCVYVHLFSTPVSQLFSSLVVPVAPALPLDPIVSHFGLLLHHFTSTLLGMS